MKTIKLALVAMTFAFVTVANAQTFVPSTDAKVTGNPKTVEAGIAATQVDFVTVGSVMPYSIGANQDQAFLDWSDALNAAMGKTASRTINWFVGATALPSGSDNQETVNIEWENTGRFSVRADVGISISGADNPPIPCAPVDATKWVYVLAAPSASVTTPNTVLNCDVEEYDIDLKVAGIGEIQIVYTVNRTPFGGSLTPETISEPFKSGTAITVAADFEDGAGQSNFDAQNAKYNLADNGVTATFKVEDLEPGYIYTVTFVSVSDQISRKSKVEPTLIDITRTLAVVPKPESTTIDHVKNVE
ncbi:MAG: hypothetical protein FWG79_05580 [Bacteroidales bacterium]|nr:hypothetical protein [Bacteroidales bacterium]